jgi:hypothetical protein
MRTLAAGRFLVILVLYAPLCLGSAAMTVARFCQECAIVLTHPQRLN